MSSTSGTNCSAVSEDMTRTNINTSMAIKEETEIKFEHVYINENDLESTAHIDG